MKLLLIVSIVSGLLSLAIADTSSKRKCLFPHFVANHTSDGLTGCVCPPHMEYDEVYGICFINQCRQICGEMQCHIQKSKSINNFQYLCSCPTNYVPITPNMNIGCTPFEESSGFKEVAKALPKNPMFLKRLGCSQTYELVDGRYRCACFEGYTLVEWSGECRPTRSCNKICAKNQICTVNDQNESSCLCKAGFSGPNCSNHFCDYKGASFLERAYLDLAIKEVCGVQRCILDEPSSSFRCDCNFGLDTRPDGLCELPKPCLPNREGYVKCTNSSNFCLIALDKWDSGHKCYPPLEQGGKPEYVAKFNRTDRIDFKISMDVRLDWWNSFYVIFLNQINNLNQPDWHRKLPKFLWQDYLDYEQRVFWSFEEVEFYREQLDDKLRNMFWKGIKSFFNGWYAPMKNCSHSQIYPAISYDKATLKMNRLIESVVHVDYEVLCDNLTLSMQELYDLFVSKQLKQNYIENYWFMFETGFVFPDSVKITMLNGTDEDKGDGDKDDGDKDDQDRDHDRDNDKEKSYNKCLDPLKKTDYSLDGITNCTCMEGYEFDSMFGSCFKNKCRQICGETMQCAILKHNVDDFEYYCYCAPGYHRVDPYYPKGCVPSLKHFRKLLDESEKKGHPLPMNPFLLAQLKCDQTYRLDEQRKQYVCDCHRSWAMNQQTKKCEKLKLIGHDRPNNCNSNQIFVIDHSVVGASGSCVCKAGFGGPECRNNLCNWPTPSNVEEASYIHESIEQFCGGSKCGLAFDQFLCKCSPPFTKDRNGRCVLDEVCTRAGNYGSCAKDKFCKILTNDPLLRGHKCICPIEQGGETLEGDCIEYRLDHQKYCLPGYVENPNPRREFPQRCVLGESTFNITFKLRFSLEANAGVLLENFHRLNDSISMSRVPVALIGEFVGYRERSLAFSMNSVWNRLIPKEKLQDILRNEIHRQNHDTDCIGINAVPSISFDERAFNLFRLSETLVSAHLSVTCANSITAEKFVDKFRRNLQHNKPNDNYNLMQNVGFVLPESIQIL